MAKFSFVDNDEGFKVVTAFVGGELKTVTNEHPHFETICAKLIAGDEENISELFDPVEKISTAFAKVGEQVAIKDGRVLFEGEEVVGLVSDHILRFFDQGVEDYAPIVKFLEKINQNPQSESRDMAYEWIQKAGLTINADGDVIGYKGVNADFTSVNAGPAIVNGEEFNGHVPNDPGNVIEMPRGEVTFDPENSCASGLHVGTYQHAQGFSGSYGKMLELVVNPRDIVSVPAHDTTKMRVCRYRVVGEIDKPREEAYADYGYEDSDLDFDHIEYGDLPDDLAVEVEQDTFTFAEPWWQSDFSKIYGANTNVNTVPAPVADTTKNHLSQKRDSFGRFIKKGK